MPDRLRIGGARQRLARLTTHFRGRDDSKPRPWAAAAGVALFLIFAVVLTLSTARGAEGGCNCFGAILPAMIGRGAIVRAVALALVAAAALTTGFEASELHPLGLVLAVSGGAAAFMLMSLWESLNPAR